MSDVIKGLSPPALWSHFAAIAAIPRPSKKEKKIADHVIGLARTHGLAYRQDSTGNVLVKKPASSGREDAAMVALQGHLDMVCEKNKDVVHDFETDGIRMNRTNGYIKADGTTLGADNGIGIAAALSLMLDISPIHGPLEFLFTVDEETGLTGAHGLKPGFLQSRTLLNLDSEEDGALYVGCAGGIDTILTVQIQYEAAPPGFVPLGISVRGLKGGHSGVDIHTNRANAIKLLVRTLHALMRSTDIRLERLEGGSKRNAIPREAEAVVHLRGERLKTFRDHVDQLQAVLKAEYATSEPNLVLEVPSVKPRSAAKILSKQDQERVVNLLTALPHGVIAMSPDIPGLVETSTNVATVQTDGDSVIIGTSQRSSVNTALDDIANVVAEAGRQAGARIEHTDGYPGWRPDLNSRVLGITKNTYRELFKTEPVVKAIHAGLECGIIGRTYQGIDMVSFGPTIEGAHSPDERVEIATVQRFWDLLVGVLRKLSQT